MGSRLVIVESPTKARTIAGFLGGEYVVESSMGHIRDLPRNAADVPEAYKGEPWARTGVDVDNDFKPLYVVTPERKAQVGSLKKLLKGVEEVYLATDEDREGEAIAWHLLEVLSPRVPVRRMVFHEITPQAITNAIANPRDIDRRLVDAQEARRILDRLYGYEVSPVLWRKVLPRLSAGRVQSVATRIVVQREWERMRFVTAGYWDLDGRFATVTSGEELGARLVGLDGKRVATGRDFGPDGRIATGTDAVVLDEPTARGLANDLADRPFEVASVESKPYRRSPAPPFITSTLQQEAGRKLRMSSAQTMRTAQSLYEQGFITYMRTDSTSLSEVALSAARQVITERFGQEFLPDAPRLYTKKVKNAQEAHEAIRPAGERFRPPEEVARLVGQGEGRLYDLIWRRTVASQMTDARGETITVRLNGSTAAGRRADFSTSGTVITHAGFQRAYVEDRDNDDDADQDDTERRLPALRQGDRLSVVALDPRGHVTQPPPRYTEASLVKRLEELGVGRPSTYASIMSTIVDRGYVWKKGSALVPSFTAFAVVRVLEQHFPDLVDYAFTARMEDDLDDIAAGSEEAVPWLSRFYFGSNDKNGAPAEGVAAGLKVLVSERLDEIDPREVNAIPLGNDPDGNPVVVRVGRYGPYLTRGEDRAGVPDDLPPDELTVERALELLAAPGDDRELGSDPETGKAVSVRKGRFGPYVQLGEDVDDGGKPRRASLFKDMEPVSIGLDDALRLLALPRSLGELEGEEVIAANGRFGPFVKKGTDTRSLATEADLFTVTLEDAQALFAEPKRRRGQGAPKPPLKEVGDDPVSGKPVVVKDGRFGPYVTDGITNASLRKGDAIEELSLERAAELLQERRDKEAAGLVGKPKARRAPAATAKAATAKTAKTPKLAKEAPATTVIKAKATKAAAKGAKAAGTSAKAKPAGTRSTKPK